MRQNASNAAREIEVPQAGLRDLRKNAREVADAGTADQSESAALRAIRHALNATDRCRVVRNTVGVDPVRGVRYGLGNGSPDLVGVLRSGRAFGVEVKSPKRWRMSGDQVAWWTAARRWGVTGGMARTVDEAMDLLAAAEVEDERLRAVRR